METQTRTNPRTGNLALQLLGLDPTNPDSIRALKKVQINVCKTYSQYSSDKRARVRTAMPALMAAADALERYAPSYRHS